MDNDNKMMIQKPEVRLFLQDEMFSVNKEGNEPYSIEKEFAKSAKGKSKANIWISLVLIALVIGLTVGMTQLIKNQNDKIQVSLDVFEDLNLKGLLDRVSKLQSDLDAEISKKAKIERDWNAALSNAEKQRDSDLYSISVMNLSAEEKKARSDKVQAEYENSLVALQNRFSVELSECQARIEEFSDEIAEYDSKNLEQAQKMQAAIDSQRQVFELEKNEISERYENDIALLETQIDEIQKSSLEAQNRIAEEISGQYQAELDRRDPVIRDGRGNVILQMSKNDQTGLTKFEENLLFENAEQTESMEKLEALWKDASNSMERMEYVASVVLDVPLEHSVPEYVSAMRAMGRSAAKSLAENSVALVNDLDNQIVGLHGDIDGLNSDIDGLNADIAGLNKNIAGLHKDIDGLNGVISDYKVQVKGLNGEISDYQNQVEGLNRNIDGLNKDIESLNRNIYGLNGNIRDYEKQVASLNQDIADLNEGFEAERSVFENRLEEAKDKQVALEKDYALLEGSLSDMSAKNNSLTAERTALQKEIGNLNSKNADLVRQYESLQSANASLERQKSAMEDDRFGLIVERRNLEKARDKLQSEVDAGKSENAKLSGENAMLSKENAALSGMNAILYRSLAAVPIAATDCGFVVDASDKNRMLCYIGADKADCVSEVLSVYTADGLFAGKVRMIQENGLWYGVPAAGEKTSELSPVSGCVLRADTAPEMAAETNEPAENAATDETVGAAAETETTE